MSLTYSARPNGAELRGLAACSLGTAVGSQSFSKTSAPVIHVGEEWPGCPLDMYLDGSSAKGDEP